MSCFIVNVEQHNKAGGRPESRYDDSFEDLKEAVDYYYSLYNVLADELKNDESIEDFDISISSDFGFTIDCDIVDR